MNYYEAFLRPCDRLPREIKWGEAPAVIVGRKEMDAQETRNKDGRGKKKRKTSMERDDDSDGLS